VIAVTAGVTPMVSLLSANALAPLLMMAAVAILFVGPRLVILGMGPKLIAAALALLTGLGLASAAWSIVPSASIYKALQLIPLFAAAYVLVAAAFSLSPQSRDRVGRALAVGVLVALPFIAAEVIAGGVLHHLLSEEPLGSINGFLRYKRGVAVIALLLAPAAYWIWVRFGSIAAAAVVVGVLLSAAFVGSGTAMVALAVGLLWAFVSYLFPSFGRRGLTVAVVAAVLGAPLFGLGPTELSTVSGQQVGAYRVNSAMHRLLIWQFASERIAERPLAGWGLASSRAVPGGNERPLGFPELLPLHPHNAALHVWLELGALGALVGAFIVASTVLRIDRTFEPGAGQVLALSAAATTIAVAFVGFGIWQSWWIGAIGLTAACTVAVLPSRSGSS